MSGAHDRVMHDVARQDRQRSGRGSPYSRPSPASRPSSDDRWQHDRFTNDRPPRDSRDRPTNNASSAPTQKLLVGGLHYEITDAELVGLFQQMGPTEKCFIRYDRSGRSTGLATVIYTNPQDAARAKREFDGANAKGQPIKISFEVYREYAPRGEKGGVIPAGPAGANKGGDLLSRMGGGDLHSRLGGNTSRGNAKPPPNAPRGPGAGASIPMRADAPSFREARGRGGGRGGGRARGTRGGRGRGPPPTADNLDAELDAFMKTPSAPSTNADADVEMK